MFSKEERRRIDELLRKHRLWPEKGADVEERKSEKETTDSSDIGKPPLITMEIETRDSPPVCQRPYNLPLKHIDWVQKELDTLEKAGVIT